MSDGATTTALRFNEGKLDMTMIPVAGLEAAARAFMFGAKKYSRNNWRKGFTHSSLLASAMRHIGEINEGRFIDPESGNHHADHALANLLMYAHHVKHGIGEDDLAATNG